MCIIKNKSITDLSIGFSHAIAIDGDGYAWSWGTGKYGELCINKTIYCPFPTRISNHTIYTQVICGETVSCFINSDKKFSYYGIIAKTRSVKKKKLLYLNQYDNFNSSNNNMFFEKYIVEVEHESIKSIEVGEGYLILLTLKGKLYCLSNEDNITVLNSEFSINSISAHENIICAISHPIRREKKDFKIPSVFNNVNVSEKCSTGISNTLNENVESKNSDPTSIVYFIIWKSENLNQKISDNNNGFQENERWIKYIYVLSGINCVQKIKIISSKNSNLCMFQVDEEDFNNEHLESSGFSSDNTSSLKHQKISSIANIRKSAIYSNPSTIIKNLRQSGILPNLDLGTKNSIDLKDLDVKLNLVEKCDESQNLRYKRTLKYKPFTKTSNLRLKNEKHSNKLAKSCDNLHFVKVKTPSFLQGHHIIEGFSSKESRKLFQSNNYGDYTFPSEEEIESDKKGNSFLITENNNILNELSDNNISYSDHYSTTKNAMKFKNLDTNTYYSKKGSHPTTRYGNYYIHETDSKIDRDTCEVLFSDNNEKNTSTLQLSNFIFNKTPKKSKLKIDTFNDDYKFSLTTFNKEDEVKPKRDIEDQSNSKLLNMRDTKSNHRRVESQFSQKASKHNEKESKFHTINDLSESYDSAKTKHINQIDLKKREIKKSTEKDYSNTDKPFKSTVYKKKFSFGNVVKNKKSSVDCDNFSENSSKHSIEKLKLKAESTCFSFGTKSSPNKSALTSILKIGNIDKNLDLYIRRTLRSFQNIYDKNLLKNYFYKFINHKNQNYIKDKEAATMQISTKVVFYSLNHLYQKFQEQTSKIFFSRLLIFAEEKSIGLLEKLILKFNKFHLIEYFRFWKNTKYISLPYKFNSYIEKCVLLKFKKEFISNIKTRYVQYKNITDFEKIIRFIFKRQLLKYVINNKLNIKKLNKLNNILVKIENIFKYKWREQVFTNLNYLSNSIKLSFYSKNKIAKLILLRYKIFVIQEIRYFKFFIYRIIFLKHILNAKSRRDLKCTLITRIKKWKYMKLQIISRFNSVLLNVIFKYTRIKFIKCFIIWRCSIQVYKHRQLDLRLANKFRRGIVKRNYLYEMTPKNIKMYNFYIKKLSLQICIIHKRSYFRKFIKHISLMVKLNSSSKIFLCMYKILRKHYSQIFKHFFARITKLQESIKTIKHKRNLTVQYHRCSNILCPCIQNFLLANSKKVDYGNWKSLLSKSIFILKNISNKKVFRNLHQLKLKEKYYGLKLLDKIYLRRYIYFHLRFFKKRNLSII